MRLGNMVPLLILCCLVQYAASQARTPATSPPPPKPVPTSSACFSGMYNPCGLGSCVNIGTNSYRCLCPKGTKVGQRMNGNPFCVPDESGGLRYTTSVGDTCYLIALTYRLNISTLQSLNPTLDCNNVAGGLSLSVFPSSEAGQLTCWIRYTVTFADTCTSIATRFRTSIATLRNFNPALDCNNLLGYTEMASICLQPWRERSKFYVCRQYVASTISSSRGCRLVAKSSRRTMLFNAGLYCGRLARFPRLFCRKAIGYNSFPSRNRNCVKGTEYLLTTSDSCSTLYSRFSGSSLSIRVRLFASFNAGMDCKDRFLFVGQLVCIPS